MRIKAEILVNRGEQEEAIVIYEKDLEYHEISDEEMKSQLSSYIFYILAKIGQEGIENTQKILDERLLYNPLLSDDEIKEIHTIFQKIV